MRALLALMRKDWRVHRDQLIWLGMVAGLPFFTAIAGYVWYNRSSMSGSSSMMSTLHAIAFTTLPLMVVPAAIFGASALSMERRDGSAEFLAMVPVTRNMIVASKFCFSWGWLLLAFIANATLSFSMGHGSPDGEGPGMDGLQNACIAVCFLSACAQAFGIGLLMSMFVSSGAAAAAAIIWSIVAPIVLGYHAPDWSVTSLFLLHGMVYLGIGCVTTCVGAWIYLRRVEP